MKQHQQQQEQQQINRNRCDMLVKFCSHNVCFCYSLHVYNSQRSDLNNFRKLGSPLDE